MKRLFLIILIAVSAVSCERQDMFSNVESKLGLILSLFDSKSTPVFVAAGVNGSGGAVWYSSNPDVAGSWTEVSIGVSLPAYGITYGKGLYVVVGGTSGNDDGFIYTSSDLKTWTPRNTGNAALQTVCYRSDIGVFCAAGYGTADRVCWSADGINWYDAINTGLNNIWLVSGGPGYFTVMGAWVPTCIYSSTGTIGTWNVSPQPPLDIPYCLTYGNGIFLCGSTRAGGGVYRSFNGYDWFPINGTPVGMGGIAGGDGVFCGIHSSNTAYFSTDNGATWPVSTSYTPTLWAVAYGGGRFVAGGTNITVFGVTGNVINNYSISFGNIYSITYKP